MTAAPTTACEISMRLIQQIVTSKHLPALFRGSETHDAALKFVCEMLRHTRDPEFVHSVAASAFPSSYLGNTLEELDGIIDWALENEEEPSASREANPSAAESALEIPSLRDLHLFHTSLKEPYATVKTANGGPLTFGVTKEIFKLWLQGQYYRAEKRALSEKVAAEIVEQLSARAIFEGPEEIVHLRYADHEEAVWVDLGDDTGSAVRITTEGWTVESSHNVRFRRSAGMLPLPEPVGDGDIDMLRTLIGLDGANWCRVVAFIVNCLRPGGPYFSLLIEGPQGSGKSVRASVIKQVIDPHRLDRIRLPSNEHDLIIQAQESALLNFDNTSRVSNNLSDSLCALLTKTSFGTRKYYTDNELRIIEACRPLMINGIGEYARRPDLVDRSIPLHLPPMEGRRKTEEDIQARLTAILPATLGVLYSAVSRAVRMRHSVQFTLPIRMADAARWITAAEGEFGFKEGELIAAVLEGQNVLLTDVIVNDPLYIILMTIVEEGPYQGMMADLHAVIRLAGNNERGLPSTAAHLSNALQRLSPAVVGLGLHIDLLNRSQKGRQVRIWRDGQEKQNKPSSWVRPA